MSLERFEPRVVLDAAAIDGGLVVDQAEFDSTSFFIRFHEQATALSQTASIQSKLVASYNALPGLVQVGTDDGVDVRQSIASYQNQPGVIYAEPNYQIQLTQTPNDPDYVSLWGLNNTGQTGGTPDADIDAVEAWQHTTGSAATIVAVVDTGIDYSHPDLAVNMWINPSEVPGDGIDNDGNGFIDDVHGYDFANRDGDPMDDHNHGTHVAGTIGGVADNGIGVTGVAWDVQLMAVKFLTRSGSGSIANAISAIEYAVDNGATISNHSWGFNGNYSQTLADAIEYARQRDHVVVAAAGNGGADQIGDNNDTLAFYPGNFPHDNLLAVAATDHNDELASFSNYGEVHVDLAAPGVSILSTTIGNTYSTFNGTSMATPHVAGVVALLRSEYPDWTYEKIRDRIFDSVDPVASLQSRVSTGGRLNAATAVTPDTTGPSAVATSPDNETMRPIDQITITFNERIDPGTFTLDDIVSFEGPGGSLPVTSVEPIAGSDGRSFVVTVPQVSTLGDYALTVGPNVADVVGNSMDQDGDGVAGEAPEDRFTARFTIIPDTVGPVVVASDPPGSLNTAIDRVSITFDEPIDAVTFTPERVLSFSGPGGDIDVLSIQPLTSTTYEIVFPTQNAQGEYTLVLGSGIADPFGNLLDQDRDGIGGENPEDVVTLNFRIERWQYASSVVDFSSQYTTTSWAATQALGVPDTFAYGDFDTAWAPRPENGTDEFLTLGFDQPAFASGAVIRETFGNGFVRQIELRDESTGLYTTVFSGPDTSLANVPYDFLVTWPQTDYPVDALRVTIDTDHNLDAFEEIDAIQLRGVDVPDTDGARVIQRSPAASATGPVDRVEVTFDEPIQDGSFTIEDVSEFSGPDGAILVNSIERLSSTEYAILFAPQNQYGEYRLTLGPDILDLQGLPMNQDDDATNGEAVDDAYRVAFELEIWQYADTVIDFSSQYGTTSWSASQALGAPDTFEYGDQRTTWAPRSMNGTTETLTVGFARPLAASGVVIRETFGNGFVRHVAVRDAESGQFIDVPLVQDDSLPGSPVDFLLSIPPLADAVDAVRIEIDTDHSSGFEEIDSVQLHGVPPQDRSGPRIIATTPDTTHSGTLQEIDLVFSEAIDPDSLTPDDILNFAGPEGPISISAIDHLAEDRVRLSFAPQTGYGVYELQVGPSIADLSGNLMDQNQDDVLGDPLSDRFTMRFAIELWQHAGSVVGFSSQYSTASWSAEQVLGPADTFTYGDARSAWAPRSMNGTSEWIAVAFDTPVESTGAIIRETFGNGFVRSVWVRDVDTGTFHQVFSGADPSQPGAPVDFLVNWPATEYVVDALRVEIDTTTSSSFEEIDAITLRGIVPPDISGPRVVATTPNASHSGSLDQVILEFNEPVDADSFTLADVGELAGPNGPVAVSRIDRLSETEFALVFPTQRTYGTYSVIVGPGIDDLAGNSMDQSDDGVNANGAEDAFEMTFRLEYWQYATEVIDFSSQYSIASWSASQALGAPDTFVFGDQRTAWAPSSRSGTTEFITLGYDQPVAATGVTVRETYGNGFVRRVEVRNAETGVFTVVSTEFDPSQPGSPVEYQVAWPQTEFLVDAIRITIDTDHALTFEEIDAVRLQGIVLPDTQGPRVVQLQPEGGQPGPIDHADVTFDEPIDAVSLTADDVALVGPTGAIAVASVTTIDDATFRLGFAPQNTFGSYSITLGPDVQDLSGNPLDQNQNGINGEVGGDEFTSTFFVELWQDATTVVDFSSQYSATSWSAAQTLGAPDTFVYADRSTAWAPRYSNAGLQHITVGYDTPVLATGAVVRETYGNGFVRQIEVRDAVTGVYHAMFDGTDPSLPGTPVDFTVSWQPTDFAVDALRVTIDTNHAATHEEIDAIRLRGLPLDD